MQTHSNTTIFHEFTLPLHAPPSLLAIWVIVVATEKTQMVQVLPGDGKGKPNKENSIQKELTYKKEI